MEPAYARTTLTWKCSGAGKVNKTTSLLTATKAGTAKITATATNKVKGTCTLPVRANAVKKMCAKPGSADVSGVTGGWTLWPLSVEPAKKGGLQCQFYLLNGTGDKVTKITGLSLSIAAGSYDNVIAGCAGQTVKASVGKSKAKLIKLTLPVTEKFSGVFLPEAYDAGKLFFFIDQGTVALEGKAGRYGFLYDPAHFPELKEAPGIVLSQTSATLDVGQTLVLTATVTREGAAEAATWSSSAPSVAAVDGGTVTALSAGTAIITAALPDDPTAKASCVVTVSAATSPDVQAVIDYGRDLTEMIDRYRDAVTVSDPGGDYATARPIVSADSLPDISAYSPAAVVTDPYGTSVIQFLSDEQAHACADYLNRQSGVAYAEPDAVFQGTGGLSADPVSNSAGWGVAAIHADKYVEYLTAREKDDIRLIVAVVDSGVNADHELFDGRLVQGRDFVDSDYDPNDENGHGSHVAGIVADCTAGLDIKILPVRVTDKNGDGDTSRLGLAILYAMIREADVINLSLGATGHSRYLEGCVKAALNKRITVVAATGNAGVDVAGIMPACMSECISVTAVDSARNLYSSSNTGDAVDITAPDVAIRSAVPGGKSKYVEMPGTSMAAPHVPAAAAMLLLDRPEYKPADVEEALKGAATDLGNKGWDTKYGAGLLNLEPLIRKTLVHGVVKGAYDNGPLVGAKVSIRKKKSETPLVEAVTASDGHFEPEVLPGFEYVLTVTHDDYQTYEETFIVQNDDTEYIFSDDIVLKMPRVKGKVVDSITGKPVADAVVEVSATTAGGRACAPSTVRTDASGAFTLDYMHWLHETPARLALTVKKEGYADTPFEYDWKPELDVGTIKLQSGEIVTVTFDKNGGDTCRIGSMEITEIKLQAGQCIPELPFTKRAGYAFFGWYNGSLRYTTQRNIYENVTLTAKWEEAPLREQITDSWEEIVKAIDDGSARSKYSVGDYKELDLGEYGVIRMMLAGFDLDERTGGGKAATTWIAYDLLKKDHRWNPDVQGSSADGYVEGTGAIGGWEKSELRQWLRDTIPPLLPASVRNHIVSVQKTQRSCNAAGEKYDQVSSETIWIPSNLEVSGNAGATDQLYYDLFQNKAVLRRKLYWDSFGKWWLRSVFYANIGLVESISTGGGSSYHAFGDRADSPLGIALCFCM